MNRAAGRIGAVVGTLLVALRILTPPEPGSALSAPTIEPVWIHPGHQADLGEIIRGPLQQRQVAPLAGSNSVFAYAGLASGRGQAHDASVAVGVGPKAE